MAACGKMSGVKGAWHSRHAAQFHHRVGYAIRQAKRHASATPCWKEGRDIMSRLSEWSKVLDTQLGRPTTMKNSAGDNCPDCLYGAPSDVATTASGLNEDTVSTLGASARLPRLRPHRRARKRLKRESNAEVIRVLAKEADLAPKLESGSFPRELFPVLEEELAETLDDVLDNDGRLEFCTSANFMWEESGSCVDEALPVMEAGRDGRASLAMPLNSGEVPWNDGGTLEPNDAQSLEEYYGPIRDALFFLHGVLRKSAPRNVDDIVLLARGLDEAKSSLTSACQVRPVFGPAAVGDVLDLLNKHLLDRYNANELAVGPGPFEWSTGLRSTAANWNSLEVDERECELSDAALTLEEYVGTLDYVTECFDEFYEDELQNRIDSYRCALNRRLQQSLNTC